MTGLGRITAIVCLGSMMAGLGCADEEAPGQENEDGKPQISKPSGQTSGSVSPGTGNSGTPSAGQDAGTQATRPTDCSALVGTWVATIQPGSTVESILNPGKTDAVEGTMELTAAPSQTAGKVSVTSKLNITKPLPSVLDLPVMEADCSTQVSVNGTQKIPIVEDVDFEVKMQIDTSKSPLAASGTYVTAARNKMFSSNGTFKAEKKK